MEIYAFYFRMNQIVFAIIFSVLSIGARLMDHTPNFVPIGALAIWAGMYLPKRVGIILPLAVMFISDSIIGFYDWRVMLSVYGSFVLMVAIGRFLRSHKGPAIVMSSLLGSVFFYFTTNFAVWASGTMYTHDWAGLMNCFYMALPFFRNTLYSDLIYGVAFVGLYESAYYYVSSKKPAAVPIEQGKPISG